MVLGASVVFGIKDADGLIAFYDNGHGPLSRIAALVPGDPVPGGVGLHALLAAPPVPWRRVLEISRRPPFVRGSGLDLGGAFSSRQPVPRHHRGRRHTADGGDFAQHHALGGALHDVPFGLRPRQSELVAWPVQIRAGNAGIPSLASHRRWSRAATPISPARFRSGISCSGPSGCRKTSCPKSTASIDQAFPSEIAGQLAYPFRQMALGEQPIVSALFAVRSLIGVRFAASGAGPLRIALAGLSTPRGRVCRSSICVRAFARFPSSARLRSGLLLVPAHGAGRPGSRVEIDRGQCRSGQARQTACPRLPPSWSEIP